MGFRARLLQSGGEENSLAARQPKQTTRVRNPASTLATFFSLYQMTVRQLGQNLKEGKVSSSRDKLLLPWAAYRLSFHQAARSPSLTLQSKQIVMENTGWFLCTLVVSKWTLRSNCTEISCTVADFVVYYFYVRVGPLHGGIEYSLVSVVEWMIINGMFVTDKLKNDYFNLLMSC